jgi:hypothetical protein
VQGNGIGSVRMTAIRPEELLQRNSPWLSIPKTRVPAPDFVWGPS